MPQARPTFAAALRDVNAKAQQARLAAAERLAQADEHELSDAVRGLCAISADREAIVRAAGLRGLGEIAAREQDPDASVPITQPSALADDEAVLEALAQRMEDTSPIVREVATIALGQVGGPRCHRMLERALRSEHPAVRFQALAGYVETSDSAQPRRVIALLSDTDAEVRGQAARALATLISVAPDARPAVIAALKGALEDTSPRTRAEAALALARLGDASGSALFAVALEDPTLRGETLEAIAALSLTSHADLIARIARNVFTTAFDRIAIARTLARLGDGRGVELLRAALGGLRTAPRLLAVQAIGELGLAELGPEVAKLVERPRGVDATTLVGALGALAAKSPEARAGLERLAAGRGRSAELATGELNTRAALAERSSSE
jgi:HEAT repeat protein